MKNKFVKQLTQDNKELKANRANRLAEEVATEVEALITEKKKAVHVLKAEIDDLTDLAPSNSYSLRPGKEGFNAGEWVNRLHECKMKLRIAEFELETALGIKKEWFSETEETEA